MRLKTVEKERWTIYAPVVDKVDGKFLDCVEQFLEEHLNNGNRSSDCEGLVNLIERAASDPSGPKALGSGLCHEVTVQGEPKIFQFIKGRLRVLWFYGRGEKVIICSHGLFKKTQRTPRPEVEKALALRKEYFDAEKNNNIILIDE